jgi:MFS family permease
MLSVAKQASLLIYVALFFNFFLVGSITPLVPRLADYHGMSDSDRSLVMSAKSFAHMAASPVVAFLCIKFSVKILFSFGVFCISGTFAGMAFSSSVAGFVCARVIQGIGVACIMVAGMSILVRVVPREKRGKYTAFTYSAIGHSTLISPLLSGVMYDRLGQIWTFLVPGVFTVGAAIISVVLLSRIAFSTGEGESIGSKDILLAVKSILAYPLSTVAFMGIFTAGVSFGCFEVTVPAILTDRLDVIQSNLMWSIGPLVFTILAPLIGMIIDKFGPFPPFVCGQILYAVLYPVFHLMQTSLAGVGTMIGIAFGIEAVLEVSIYPIMAAIVDSRKPHALPTVAYSLNEIFIQAGFAVGALLGVLMYDWGGLRGIGFIIGPWNTLLAITSCIFIITFSKRDRVIPTDDKS